MVIPAVQAATNPLDWARANATIVNPRSGRIPFQPYPYQAEFLAAGNAQRRLILKARQVGFSQVFALESLYAATHIPDTTVLLVSRTQDLAINLLRYCYLTYNNLRDAPALEKANESEMGFANGSRIKSIPANRSTGRGFTAHLAYLDEFAHADYANDIYQSVLPSVALGGKLVVGSTPNGIGNLFHELYIGGEDFIRICTPWYECPAYYTPAERALGIPREQASWFLRERPKYTARQWASEYECDFVGSGEAVFRMPDIDRAEMGALGEAMTGGNRRYLTSVDVGRRQDATVINTFDVTGLPFQRVAHERMERMPYPVIQAAIESRWRAYGGELVVESNGVGDPVIENLSVPATAFITSAKTKTQAIQSLALLLENGNLKAKWTDQERKELTMYKWDDKALVQDCVMSLAIGAQVMADIGELASIAQYAKANQSAMSRWHDQNSQTGSRWGVVNSAAGRRWRR